VIKKVTWSLGLFSIMSLEAGVFSEALSNSTTEGQVRFGAVEIEDEEGEKSSTVALGGSLGVKTAPINGLRVGATFYTTNALFGKNNEGMFLDANKQSYSIVGEAYLEANLGKTSIKAGRQRIETPYADSDDIGMIPNTFEGVTLINQDIKDTTLIFASLDKWSGVDSDRPQEFTNLQASGDALLMAGVLYEGVKNTTLQASHYKLDNANFNYIEAGYETERFNVGIQYTTQESDNTAFGLQAGITIGNLILNTAYNRVNGIVRNGFGGGPFFTSAEDHTIEIDERDEEGILLSAEYSLEKLTLLVSHANFEKGENDTDYIMNYDVNDNHALTLIYSDMYDDGTMVRFFANYNF